MAKPIRLVENADEKAGLAKDIDPDARQFVKWGFLMSSTDSNNNIIYRPTFALLLLTFMLIVLGFGIFIAGRWTGFEAGKQETESQRLQSEIETIKKDVKTSKEFQIKNAETLKNKKEK